MVTTHERLTAGSLGAASMDPSLRWGVGGWGDGGGVTMAV